MAKGVRWDITTFTIGAISGMVDENKSLAYQAYADVKWRIEERNPVAEIIRFNTIVWRESYCASHFHIAYALMIRGINKKLKAIIAAQEEELKRTPR